MTRQLAWALTYVAFALLGRATVIDGGSLALVWPAAGVAVLWLTTSPASERWISLIGLVGSGLVIYTVTGAAPSLALLLVTTGLLQALVFIGLMRRYRPDVWGFGGTRPISGLADLAVLLSSSAVACLLGALVGNTGLWLVGADADLSTFALGWGRNFTGQSLLTTLGILLLEPWSRRADGRDGLRRLRIAVAASDKRASGAEIVGLSGLSLTLLTIVFVVADRQPLAFVLLFTTVLVGVRLSPFAVALHGCITGAIAIAFTLGGLGPFADIPSLYGRALVSQLFVVMTVTTGLVLALNRAERDDALRARIKSEREIHHRATLFDAILQNMTEGIAVIRDDNTIEMRNPAGRTIMGVETAPSTTMRPTGDYGLFHLDGRRVAETDTPYARVFRGEEVTAEDYLVRNPMLPDGRVIEVTATELASLAEVGAPQRRRAVVNFRDVTLDREERDHLASFAGVVAHDLANPLTVIDGWAEALEDQHRSGTITKHEALHMIGRVRAAATHMSAFIKDLLAYTVAREAPTSSTTVDVSAVADEVAIMRRDSEALPHIEIQPGLTAYGDPVLVRQLLDNLIGNAVKYVPPGQRPDVRITGREREDQVEIRVTDNGIGIPQSERSRVFRTFERAHSDEYRGTGLGLAICRQVVDRHGGSIWIEDNGTEPGTTFAFTLPKVPHEAPRERQDLTPDDPKDAA